MPGYWQRHRDALAGYGLSHGPGSNAGIQHERALVRLLQGWASYADAHRAAFDCKLSDDNVLGEPWATIGRALIRLLDGELGRRLDGGALDAFLRNTLHAEGFDPND